MIGLFVMLQLAPQTEYFPMSSINDAFAPTRLQAKARHRIVLATWISDPPLANRDTHDRSSTKRSSTMHKRKQSRRSSCCPQITGYAQDTLFARSASTFRKRRLPISADASRPRNGPKRKRSRISRRACRSRRCRNSRAIGRRITTGASARRS